MAKLANLRDALVHQLEDLYDAETQLLAVLPEMAKNASRRELGEFLQSHLKETARHLERLDSIAGLLQVKLTGKTCLAMQGLVGESKEVLALESDSNAVADLLLIGVAQRIEHYEIAAYETVLTMATELGEGAVVTLLTDTLDEEVIADERFNLIVADGILYEANKDQPSTGAVIPPLLGGS